MPEDSGAWVPVTGEWVKTPTGDGQVSHIDADTETAVVRVNGVLRHYALAALSKGRPTSAWGL